MSQKFATAFTPVFRACDVGSFCLLGMSEKCELQYLLKYRPFSTVAASCSSLTTAACMPQKALDIHSSHKSLIQSEWKLQLASRPETFSFDDAQIIEKVNKQIEQEITNDDQLLIRALDTFEAGLGRLQQKSSSPELLKRQLENEAPDRSSSKVRLASYYAAISSLRIIAYII